MGTPLRKAGPVPPCRRGRPRAGRGGLLYPQQNQLRNVLDLSGLWQFQLDPKEEGEAKGWFKALPAPRQIAVPCSWNDLFDDARDYLGLAWYLNEVLGPVRLARAARVPARRLGELRREGVGQRQQLWPSISADTCRSSPKSPTNWRGTGRTSSPSRSRTSNCSDRVPPGPGPGGGGVAGVLGGFPLTTYDFFPYAGLHRPVLLYSVPPPRISMTSRSSRPSTARTASSRSRSTAAGEYAGKGKARLNEIEADLNFRAGSAEATLRVPSARFWSPQDPHLYPLTVTLTDGQARHRLLHARRRHPHRRGARRSAAAERAADQAHRASASTRTSRSTGAG